jgi:hypothetical protein
LIRLTRSEQKEEFSQTSGAQRKSEKHHDEEIGEAVGSHRRRRYKIHRHDRKAKESGVQAKEYTCRK